ncbi:MAG: HAD family hydrolase [Clostridiales bacterium]|jgi:beta-phosphoglucomutase-like phosphatase (HAD superfamily)|nr:HAD family hydrolase [Clostridiales bacterium]
MTFPDFGSFEDDCGLIPANQSGDGRFTVGGDGVTAIAATGDKKVEFIGFASHTMARVNSQMGYPAYYPVHPAALRKPVEAVLMDLDGTSVRSEEFWIWIIELTVKSLTENARFSLEDSDLPFVSGHSVSEHLRYCIGKYCPEQTVERAREFYFRHTRREMKKITEGTGRADAFTPAPGLKDFLYGLKSKGIKIGLVTSGLFEKAWPEILSAFRTLHMGDPLEFYDTVISAGHPLQKGGAGTLGELSPKPHPWLYAEAFRVGLGMDFARRNHALGIEDSAAGVCSIRLAGIPTAGISGGNIEKSGAKCLCNFYRRDLSEIFKLIEE